MSNKGRHTKAKERKHRKKLRKAAQRASALSGPRFKAEMKRQNK